MSLKSNHIIKFIFILILLLTTLFPPILWSPIKIDEKEKHEVNEFKNFSFLFGSEIESIVIDSTINTYEFSKKEDAKVFIKSKTVIDSIIQKEQEVAEIVRQMRANRFLRDSEKPSTEKYYYQVTVKEQVKYKFKRSILMEQLILEYLLIIIIFFSIKFLQTKKSKESF